MAGLRLLIISPFFPPLAIAEAFCSGLFVRALQAAGVEVQVVMSSNTLPNLVADASAAWGELRSVVHDVPNPPRLSFLRRVGLSARYQIASWTAWTDAVVTLAEELHKQRPFSAVVSRSLPLHAHYAGFWTSRRLRLPWFVNINDPFDFAPFVGDPAARRQWSPGLDERRWHRRILQTADVVTFPCERLRTHTMRGVNRSGPSCDVPHVAIPGERRNLKETFLVIHAGRIGMNDNTNRSADTVLDGFVQLVGRHPDKRHLVKLRFVGPSDPGVSAAVSARGLEEVVEYTGTVTYEESLEHINEASTCLLVEGAFSDGVFLPSKLCNYLVARKPVIALSPPNGTVADLARNGGILRVTHGDVCGAGAALDTLFRAFLSGNLGEYAPPAHVADSFLPANVAKRFLAIPNVAEVRPSAAHVSLQQ